MTNTLDFERSRPTRPARRRAAELACLGGLILALAGCDDLQPTATYEMITDPARIYASITLDHRAVTMALTPPYNTAKLTATVRNGKGEPMSGMPAPTFRSSDSTRVWVSPTGELEARSTGGGILIIAEMTSPENIYHADTAIVNVTALANPPQLTTFRIDRENVDPLAWGLLASNSVEPWFILALFGVIPFPEVTVQALDQNGVPITGLSIDYRSLRPEVAVVDRVSGQVTSGGFIPIPGLLKPGKVEIVASTLSYGVAKADTAEFAVTYPAVQGVYVELGPDGVPRLSPDEVIVVKNGFVGWVNSITDAVEIVFDNPAQVGEATVVCMIFGPDFCGGGDIAPFTGTPILEGPETLRYRHFPTAGTYTFRVKGAGIDLPGRVVVIEE